MPVSLTTKRRVTSSSDSSTFSIWSRTSPRSVNLTALPSRLRSTWRRRPGSPRNRLGSSAGSEQTSSRSLLRTCSANKSSVLSTISRRWKSRVSNVKRPDSIFEKSRISLTMLISDSALARMVSPKSRCSGVRFESSKRPVMPIMPFMGVRISWLMLARNSLLARLAVSAASLALTNSPSARLRAVMSVQAPTNLMTLLPRSSS